MVNASVLTLWAPIFQHQATKSAGFELFVLAHGPCDILGRTETYDLFSQKAKRVEIDEKR